VDLGWIIYGAELLLLTCTRKSQLYKGPRNGTLVKKNGKRIKLLVVSNWNLNLENNFFLRDEMLARQG